MDSNHQCILRHGFTARCVHPISLPTDNREYLRISTYYLFSRLILISVQLTRFQPYHGLSSPKPLIRDAWYPAAESNCD